MHHRVSSCLKCQIQDSILIEMKRNLKFICKFTEFKKLSTKTAVRCGAGHFGHHIYRNKRSRIYFSDEYFKFDKVPPGQYPQV